jgi:hypothetical protein
MKLIRMPLALAALMILAPIVAEPLDAQDAAAETPPASPVVIEGEDLPQFIVVEAFFHHALAYRRHESPGMFQALLRNVGMEPESPAAKQLDAALTEAEVVLAMPTVDPTLDTEEAYSAFQTKAIREKARLLGHVYATLLRNLRTLGDTDLRLREYIETETRSNTRMFAKSQWPHEFLDAVRSFDQEMDAVLGGRAR